MGRRLSATELRRFALAKMRIGKSNSELPKDRRLSSDQLDRFLRAAAESGHINEEGYIVKSLEG